MFFDPLYFVILSPALLLGFWAQYRVRSAFAEGEQVGTRRPAEPFVRGTHIQNPTSRVFLPKKGARARVAC